MNKQKKIQVLKGFRDFLPQQAVIRNKVKEILVKDLKTGEQKKINPKNIFKDLEK